MGKNYNRINPICSESSMFVSDFRIILKTCGTTRLLHIVGRILHLAKVYCNMENVISVFYSRKNFMHPERQPYPHSSFETEVDYLEEHFSGITVALSIVKFFFLVLLFLKMRKCFNFQSIRFGICCFRRFWLLHRSTESRLLVFIHNGFSKGYFPVSRPYSWNTDEWTTGKCSQCIQSLHKQGWKRL